MSFKQTLETYFSRLSTQLPRAVPETGHYNLLKDLLDAVGQSTSPHITAIIHPKNDGAGIPDLGLFADNQGNNQKPDHGVLEVKGIKENPDKIAKSEQVKKYLDAYGLVLVTNFREFLLVSHDADGNAVLEERYSLGDSADDFEKALIMPRRLADQHATAFYEYLLRVMRRTAPLTDPKDVAWMLASYAREARARIEASTADLSTLNTIRTQLEKALGLSFTDAEGEEFFRSTLVQTLFYGVFSAWVLWHENNPNTREAFDLWKHIRQLNVPVIQELFHQISNPQHLQRLNIEVVLEWTAEALNRVEPVFFEKFQRGEAIQYFYEPFLEAFDPDLRKQLGVWYTPPEIVEYMVARVDQALKDELGIVDGLLDDNVYILDPCCGTGAYLVEVVRRIYREARKRGEGALAGHTVLKALTSGQHGGSRIFGFEILPAPFVIAHLQIGMLLAEMQAPMPDHQRAGVYLTNALTGWDEVEQLNLDFPELKKEHDAARYVKRQQPILVILGNPPYSGYAGVAMGEENELKEAYRTTKQAPKPQGQGLNDLYIRFFRMAERKIVENTHQGIVCFISNYSWLDGLSHTGMRERYMEVFDNITIDSLNGDKFATGKKIPAGLPKEGKPDPSVFSTPFNREGIQVGTAVALLVRHEQKKHGTASIQFRNVWGKSKLEQVKHEAETLATITYETLVPEIELGLPFKPRIIGKDYLTWPKLPDVFPISFPGVKTSRDSMLVDIDKDRLQNRMNAYFNPEISHEKMRRIEPSVMKETKQYPAIETRNYLQKRGFQGSIVRHSYRPFDVRWLYWDSETKLLDRNRAEYFPHVNRDNPFFLTTARTRRTSIEPPIATYNISDLNLMDGGMRAFPLYLYDETSQKASQPKTRAMFADDAPIDQRRPNLSSAGLAYLDTIHCDEKTLFLHVLAVMHAPAYRLENAGALRQDWPRIPLPSEGAVLENSAALGQAVAQLLDVENPVDAVTTGVPRPDLKGIAVLQTTAEAPDFRLMGWGYMANGATMPAGGNVTDNEDGTFDIYLNASTFWQRVPAEVWEYTLGGYQVLKKWLSYRDMRVLERPLHAEEAREFMHIARRIAALLALEDDLNMNYQAIKANTYNWPVK